jgi:hypothetical protein
MLVVRAFYRTLGVESLATLIRLAAVQLDGLPADHAARPVVQQ